MTKEDKVHVALLHQRIQELPYRCPFDLHRLLDCFPPDQVVAHARSVRPIVPASLFSLLTSFLDIKRSLGSPIEQALYATHVTTPSSLIHRLLTKRPLVFWLQNDAYLLRNGRKGQADFERIGTSSESSELQLSNLLSYDEMMLSALIGVSVPTFFLNSGSRDNLGGEGEEGSFEREGVYVGMVGARLEKAGVMEWQYCVVTREQNTVENGYGAGADDGRQRTQLLRMWARYYGQDHFPTYDEALTLLEEEEKKRHRESAAAEGQEGGGSRGRGKMPSFLRGRGGGQLFNAAVYRARVRMNAETYLLEANDRAAARGGSAYVIVVGLGLGVWAYMKDLQTAITIEAYHEVVTTISLPHISEINFTWMSEDSHQEEWRDCDDHPILALCTKRNPAVRLEGGDAGKLLVAMYAWDGNAWPGNEYWLGQLNASGDPAAVCCSTLAILQNPDVNSEAFQEAERIKAWGQP